MKTLLASIFIFTISILPSMAEAEKGNSREDKLKTQLLQQATDVISFVKDTAKNGADLVKEQAPILIKEILNYNLCADILRIIFPWIIVIILACVWKKSYDKIESADDGFAFISSISGMLMVVMTIFAMIIFFVNALDLIKIIFAPRLYMLEHLKRLL